MKVSLAHEFKVGSGVPVGADLSQDGKKLVVRSTKNLNETDIIKAKLSLSIIDLETQRVNRIGYGVKAIGFVGEVLFVPNSNYLLSYGERPRDRGNGWYAFVDLYDLQNYRLQNRIEAHADDMFLKVSNNGKRFASLQRKSNILKVWSIPSCELLQTLELDFNLSGDVSVRQMSISEDGSTLLLYVVSSSYQESLGEIFLFDLEKPCLRSKISFTDKEAYHQTPVISEFGDYVFLYHTTSSYPLEIKKIHTYSAETGKLIEQFKLPKHLVTIGAFSPDNRVFCSHEHDGFIHFYDALNGDKLSSIEPVLQGELPIIKRFLDDGKYTRPLGYSFSRAGDHLISYGYDNKVKLWKLNRIVAE